MNPIKCNNQGIDANINPSMVHNPIDKSSSQQSVQPSDMFNELASQLNRISVGFGEQSQHQDENNCYYMFDRQDPDMEVDPNQNQDHQLTHKSRDQYSRGTRPIRSRSLIVTNVDPALFGEEAIRQAFESLFLNYDKNLTFTYLKSFKRVRIDVDDENLAQTIQANLDRKQFYRTHFRCYLLQKSKNLTSLYKKSDQKQRESSDDANFHHNDDLVSFYDDGSHRMEGDENCQSNYLTIPKLTKQFLISPPASPPVGWEPVHEGSPVMDVQLISAIANLVPGKLHEIHQGNESQPGIFVEVCEDPRYAKGGDDMPRDFTTRIPKTMSPESFRSPNQL